MNIGLQKNSVKRKPSQHIHTPQQQLEVGLKRVTQVSIYWNCPIVLSSTEMRSLSHK